MAVKKDSTNTLADDIKDVIAMACPIESMMAGVVAMLEEKLEDVDDRDGMVWHSLQLAKLAQEKIGEMFAAGDQLKLAKRAQKLEEVAA